MIYPNGMKKLFKSCGSWNPGSFQITSFHVSSVDGTKACSPWRKSNWNAELEPKIYVWKFVALLVLRKIMG